MVVQVAIEESSLSKPTASSTKKPRVKRPPAVKPIRPKRFPCPQCGVLFDRPCSVRQHILTHTGEKPHSCACGTAFAARNNLYRHERKCKLRAKILAEKAGEGDKNDSPRTGTGISATSTTSSFASSSSSPSSSSLSTGPSTHPPIATLTIPQTPTPLLPSSSSSSSSSSPVVVDPKLLPRSIPSMVHQSSWRTLPPSMRVIQVPSEGVDELEDD